MEPYSGDTKVIAKVGTTPEDRGLETEDFKAKFDEGLTAFVQWFNTVHKTEFEAHLADFAKVNGQADLWNGYANSGNLTLSESVDNFSMLSISINKNPATSANKGIVVIPSFGLASHNYIPVAFGTAMTWIRILVVGNIFTIHSAGNAELFIIGISGLGRKPNT